MTAKREPRATAGGDRKQLLFLVLAAVFLTNALVAELIGGKLVTGSLFGFDYTQSVGIFLWPVVFVTSDIINEYFGRRGVRRLSILGATMIAYAFVALSVAGIPAAASFSPVSDASYRQVFFQSRWIIVGSITAFLVAQLLDVTVFWLLRRRTGAGLLWVRATGSTLVSQLVDTFIVGFIGLHLPWRFGLAPPRDLRLRVQVRNRARGDAGPLPRPRRDRPLARGLRRGPDRSGGGGGARGVLNRAS